MVVGDSTRELSRLLSAWGAGEEGALDRLMPLVYQELRRLASARLQRERPGHTLQTTELVHEAFLRLARQDRTAWESRTQFFAVAARVMRRVLVDHARRRKAGKRGGDPLRISIERARLAIEPAADFIDLDECLGRLERLDPQQARVVELRFFAGCTTEEVADLLGISPSTVKREWRMARVWLRAELESCGPPRVTDRSS